MKNRKPASFILMCIVLALILIGIVPGFFMRSSETPSWYGAIMLVAVLLSVFLPPIALILALIYKTDDAKNRQRNKLGLWSSVGIIALVVGTIIYAVFFFESQRGMWG